MQVKPYPSLLDLEPLPPDLACLVPAGFNVRDLRDVARTARRHGVSAHRVLISAGRISEESYYRQLAAHHGLAYYEGGGADLRIEAFNEAALGTVCRAGLLNVTRDAQHLFLAAPADEALLSTVQQLIKKPALCERFLVTSPPRLRALVLAQARQELLRYGVHTLEHERPRDSARRSFLPFIALCTTVLVLLAACAGLNPPGAWPLLSLGVALLFLQACYYRILAWADGFETPAAPPMLLPAERLPVYSVLVPLYRETPLVVAQLIAALKRLDYPAAKLDILLLVEDDDRLTRQALAAEALPTCFRIMCVPPGDPRTKPRVLQLGLAFARGSLLTIFDAEDIPEPLQLQKAAAAFHGGPPGLACLQAELRIDNRARNWLTRQFALEYAALFTVFLPGMAKRGLPILLGGTSNHFRTSILRRVGGWDPWNVTEDADLGVRLARGGYATGIVHSYTEEEAPHTLRNWFAQRRRWQKGWMQTIAVHFSQGHRLVRDLGWRRYAALAGTLGTTLFAALFYPLMILWFGAVLLFDLTRFTPTFLGAFAFGVALAAFVGGNVLPLLHIHKGAQQRGWHLRGSDVLSVFGYWLLISAAAYVALFELAVKPFYWARTVHEGRAAVRPRIRHEPALFMPRAKTLPNRARPAIAGAERRAPRLGFLNRDRRTP